VRGMRAQRISERIIDAMYEMGVQPNIWRNSAASGVRPKRPRTS